MVPHAFADEAGRYGIHTGNRTTTALSRPDSRRLSDVGVFRPGDDMALRTRGVLSHNTIILR